MYVVMCYIIMDLDQSMHDLHLADFPSVSLQMCSRQPHTDFCQTGYVDFDRLCACRQHFTIDKLNFIFLILFSICSGGILLSWWV